MKTIIILGDGMSDHPVKALGGKTPLMAANKPSIDLVAKMGRTGFLKTIPDGMSNGSAVANLTVLGYDAKLCFQGRGVLEAASMNVPVNDGDVAMRCNLICVNSDGTIKNHSAGHISNEEAFLLISALDKELGAGTSHPVKFYPGVSYRHLLVLEKGWASPSLNCAPPHDHVGENAESLYPKATDAGAEDTAAFLKQLHLDARKILENHPVNIARINRGLDPANSIWTWSPGLKPSMDTFKKLYGKSGAVISAVDLIQGLGVLSGMDKIIVEGATGLHDTNYEGKSAAALEAIKTHDLVYLHVEATDEAGHSKDLELKIKCIEYLDSRIVKPVLDGIKLMDEKVIVAVLPDHPTPVETGAHASDPVPVAIWNPELEADESNFYDEQEVKKGALGLMEKNEFMLKALGLH
ncbi:MAG: cofactor-independent phosphoglycerate mutase [Deltaproteobacteria bacterium]|nr:cofactor-independent phosphoglycerate mutase [Deltaproteobacteria bacterium]